MIIKIDHIAYSSLDLDSDIKKFENIGYDLAFKESNLENLSIKKDFLNHFGNKHQLALMTKKICYSIEILNHNNINTSEGFIEPFNLEDENFNKIIINTDNIENSINFWKLLGFSPTQEVDKMQEMKFSSPLESNAFYIYLSYNKPERKFLDDKGYNCVALITNSAKREQDNLIKKGFSTSEIEELEVNGQKLKIFFVQRDNCEIVEIIEIVR